MLRRECILVFYGQKKFIEICQAAVETEVAWEESYKRATEALEFIRG